MLLKHMPGYKGEVSRLIHELGQCRSVREKDAIAMELHQLLPRGSHNESQENESPMDSA